MKILLAEDDRVSRMIMQRMLQSFGYEVAVAEDGLQAVNTLSQPDAPRLALVDWMMPGLDGLGVCRQVRNLYREGAYVYLLLLTSKQNSEDIVAGLEAGADDYITKPCQPAELKARLLTGRRILLLEEKLVEAREEMRYKAMHDALTGLWNRAAILPMVETELQRSSREGTPTSIVLCDVDQFKRINDNYGHAAGDLVLQEVARRLTASVRTYDAVGRYGGEEFLILLSHCDESAADTRCEQIRAAVFGKQIDIGSRAITVSISLGAVTCGDWNCNLPFAKLLASADAALYRAKNEGRNRTVLAQAMVQV